MSKNPTIIGSLEPLTRMIQGPFTCVVVLGFDSATDAIQSVLECCKPVSQANVHYMRQAVDLEQEYLWHRIDFRQPQASFYPAFSDEELTRVGSIFNIENVVCAIVCNTYGDIAIGRKYFCTEQTRLERAYEKLMIHSNALSMLAPPDAAL